MVIKNTRTDKLCLGKDFATKDTSYSSFWLYNKERDLRSDHFKDRFVNFYDEKILLSEFNPTVAKNIISYWSEPKDIVLDPFAGRTRALVAFAMDRKYIGYEVSTDVIKYLQDRFDSIGLRPPEFNAEIRNEDCLNIRNQFTNNTVDLVFSCPPYWNLERYQEVEGQLSSIKTYDGFLVQLIRRLSACIDALKIGKYMCMVVGDFRKDGLYHTFHADIIARLLPNKKVKLHDIVVIQNIPFHTAAFYFGTRKKNKITSKSHEYLLIWKKVNDTGDAFICAKCRQETKEYGRKGICRQCYIFDYNKEYWRRKSGKVRGM